MIYADWHPDDERLLNRYLDGGDRDESCDRHLAWCNACAERFRILSGLLERAHQSAWTAADAAFDAPRLERQRAGVLARLGAESRGRVLAFPPPAGGGWREAWFPRPSRFVAAAAVLAVAIGGWAGSFVVTPDDQAAPAAGAESGGPGAAPAVLVTGTADESIFSEIDMALAHPRTAELRALDDLTPHARDIVASGR